MKTEHLWYVACVAVLVIGSILMDSTHGAMHNRLETLILAGLFGTMFMGVRASGRHR